MCHPAGGTSKPYAARRHNRADCVLSQKGYFRKREKDHMYICIYRLAHVLLCVACSGNQKGT